MRRRSQRPRVDSTGTVHPCPSSAARPPLSQSCARSRPGSSACSYSSAFFGSSSFLDGGMEDARPSSRTGTRTANRHPARPRSQAGFLFHQRNPGHMTALPLPNSAFPPAEQVAPRIGARAVCEALVREGVTTIFGYPGGTVLPIYDVLREFPLRHILVRHEQGGAHAADGYSRATGGVGVAIATSGPGAINLVTGLATAMMDSVPMVAITGNVPRALLGKDAFQETDIVGIALPVTKYATVVMDPDEVPYAVAEAFEIARSGRPGPVLLDFPKDVLQLETSVPYPEPYQLRLPGLLRPVRGDVPEADDLAEMIAAAERPLILSGHGVQIAGAVDLLLQVARAHRDPGCAHAARDRQHGRDASAVRRVRRHARLDARQQDDPAVRPADRDRLPIRRPDHRQDEHVRAERADRARRRRPKRDRQERAHRPRASWPTPATCLPRCCAGCRSPSRGRSGWTSWPPGARSARRARGTAPVPGARGASAPTTSSTRSARPPVTRRRSSATSARTRCGRRATSASATRTGTSAAAGWAPWATRSPRPWARRSVPPSGRRGRSSATAASR